MAELSDPVVALYIVGDDLNPREISALLGVEPDDARTKGERRITSSGREVVAKAGLWSLERGEKPATDLNGQIAELLSRVTADEPVWRRLSERYWCRIAVGIFMREGNEGAELQPRTLGMLAARGLSLDLDLYGPMED